MTSGQAKNEVFEPDRLARKPEQRNTMKVFIADDSLIIRERLKAMLSEVPEVEISGQAQDAQTALRNFALML